MQAAPYAQPGCSRRAPKKGRRLAEMCLFLFFYYCPFLFFFPLCSPSSTAQRVQQQKKKTPDTPVSVTFFFSPFFKRGSFLCLSIMQPYPYAPSNQTYTYGAPPPPQQPYGGYSQQPPPPPQQGCYAPTPYANYPPAPPPQGGCYAIPSTGSYPPPPRPFPPQPPMQPNVPPAANYVLGGPGYPPLAPPVNNYDPRRNDYRY